MRILIATPLYPPDIGGPAKYAKALHEEFAKGGNGGVVVAYGRLEKLLPPLVRHVVYFLRLLPSALRADAILALDTWSVGVPALYAARLLRKRFLVRVGGDLAWEFYIERTSNLVKLADFYAKPPRLSLRERLVLWGARRIVRSADRLLFNSSWQRDIWMLPYRLDAARALVVENVYPPVRVWPTTGKKVFVAAGRGIRYKNIERFSEAFAVVQKKYPDIELDTQQLPPQEHLERVAKAYAIVVPSVSEINSNILIEGVALGKPFIAPKDSGMRERLAELGMFIDTLEESELERAVEELLDKEKYQALVARIAAFSYVRTWSNVAEDVLNAAHSV